MTFCFLWVREHFRGSPSSISYKVSNAQQGALAADSCMHPLLKTEVQSTSMHESIRLPDNQYLFVVNSQYMGGETNNQPTRKSYAKAVCEADHNIDNC